MADSPCRRVTLDDRLSASPIRRPSTGVYQQADLKCCRSTRMTTCVPSCQPLVEADADRLAFRLCKCRQTRQRATLDAAATSSWVYMVPAQTDEEFFVCKWTVDEASGAPLLLLAGKNSVLRVLDVMQEKLLWVRSATPTLCSSLKPAPTVSSTCEVPGRTWHCAHFIQEDSISVSLDLAKMCSVISKLDFSLIGPGLKVLTHTKR